MPQSLNCVICHAVFSVKRRQDLIHKDLRKSLHEYFGGILRKLGCPPIQIGGVGDHVHLLFQLSRTASIAQVIEQSKIGTSKWMKEMGVTEFSWQNGYGIFSVSASDLGRVAKYVANQEAHHFHVSFMDEFRSLLTDYEIEFDERYVWD